MTKNLTDLQLFQLCQKYGAAALEARRKFLGLLPEVNRREIWRGKGFQSIFHFAAVLGGVSEEQTRRVLNIEKRIASMPDLHKALVKGEVSVNKIAKVVSVATIENQQELAVLTRNLSTRALETLISDEKENVHVNTNLPELFSESNRIVEMESILVTKTIANRLNALLEKGLDLNEILKEMLDKREADIAAAKAAVADEVDEGAHEHGLAGQKGMEPRQRDGRGSGKQASRYIPVRIRRLMRLEYGKKCAMDGCRREAGVIHHTRRFAMSGAHNPNYLAPLCRQHHEIAHKIDWKVLAYWREGVE